MKKKENNGLRISVFGASTPQPLDPAYVDARRLGSLLGKAGYTVMTGGYGGTMEAVSRGAAEAGGHVIGVTCQEIETWRPGGANSWVEEEIKLQTLKDRMYTLIEQCDGAFALPGGIGTLAEVAVMWSNLQTGVITPRPLILIGRGWQGTFSKLYEHQDKYILTSYRALLMFASQVEEGFGILRSKLTNHASDSTRQA
jgi:uncharacterized protein (TIGR00725 family)